MRRLWRRVDFIRPPRGGGRYGREVCHRGGGGAEEGGFGRLGVVVKRLILAFLGVASLGVLVAVLVGGPVAELVFAFLAVAFPPGLMLLGVEKKGRLGSAVWPIALLLLLLLLSVAGMFAFRGQVLGAPRVLGLPPAAAIQILGLFVLPLVVVALGFAWTFEGFGPTREELEELRSIGPERPGS